MDKKKGGFLRGIVDNFRSSVGSSGVHTGLKSGSDILEIDEPLKPDNFELTQVVRYGFPNKPSAVAFDPLQRLVAIGTKNGHIRIIGKPGVDLDIETVDNKPVSHLAFIVAETALLCVTSDPFTPDNFYLYRLKDVSQPKEIICKLPNKEKVTFLYTPISCKWVYFGTERGNVHILNIKQGYLSDYVINWNKAIEISRKSHPGSVIHISDCPADNSRILIGYSSGFVTVWDAKNKDAEFRITHPEPITSICWHHEGKQFLVSHTDGSISTWSIKTSKPNSIVFPHAKVMIDETRPETCKPIQKVAWKTARNTADSFIIFSGGLPVSSTIGRSSAPPIPVNQAQSGANKANTPTNPRGDKTQELDDSSNDQSIGCLTIIHGKSTTVLEMEYPIVDFVVCCEQLYEVETNDPYAVIALLTDDLVVIDLTSKDFPCFRNVHAALQLHQQLPITACSYLVDIPMDLNTSLYTAGLKCQATNAENKTLSSSCNKRTKSGQAICTNTERLISTKDWPLTGGDWSSSTLSYSEFVITGHADGSIKFFDVSSSGMHLVLKVRTSKLFTRTKLNASSGLQQTHSSGSASSPSATQTAQQSIQAATVSAASAITSKTSKYALNNALNKQQPSQSKPINQSSSPQQQAPQITQQSSSTSTTYSPVHTPIDNKDISSKELSSQKNAPTEQFKAFIETPFAIEHICFSPEDKVLVIANSSSTIVFFKFSKSDIQSEVPSMLVSLNYEYEDTKVLSETSSSQTEQVTQGISGLLRSDEGHGSSGRTGGQSKAPNVNNSLYYIAKKELIKRPAGFQPELIIHTPFINEKQGPPKITSLSYLSFNYLLAYGNENGITIVDIIQKSIVFNISTPDIYGPMDPIQRFSKSPKKMEAGQADMDRGKSPTNDQLNGFCQSPTNATAANQCSTPTSASSSFQAGQHQTANSAQSTPQHHLLTSQQSFCYSNLNKRFSHLAREAVQAANNSASGGNSAIGGRTTNKRMLRMQSLQSMCLTDQDHQAKTNFFNLSVGSATEKADTFSRSSSVCSIEGTGLEPITNILFAYTFTNKSDKLDTQPSLSIWVGTRFGTITAFNITFPESQESRELCLQTINIQNTNSVFRLKGSVLNLTILDLDHNGQILVSASKGRQPNRNSKGHASNFVMKTRSPTATNLGSPGVTASSSSMSNVSSGLPSSSTSQSANAGDPGSSNLAANQNLQTILPANTQQLLLVVSERQARVIALPSQAMIGKCILSSSQLAVRADVVYMKSSDAVCLFVYFQNGQVCCYALPSLRIIKELELEITSPDFKIESNLNFNLDGHLVHFTSHSEIAKYCANSTLHDNLLLLKPTLAKDLEIPEPPKQGFIKSIFGSTPFEKDEVFASTPPQAATTSRTASAKQFKQQSGVEGLRQAVQGSAMGEIAKTRQAFVERGEQIEKLENATEKMASEAGAFKDLSAQLLSKYKDRKWWM